tara:strand:+ start:1370 stop:1942 length:573 start_codon:yes stop_codon:yes gene_type:complete
MEEKLQTKVTLENQKDFYWSLYSTGRSLIDLKKIVADQYLLVDCRGQQYCKNYPDLNIITLETITTAKQFNFTKDQFNYLIDNQVFNKLNWPKISTKNCVVIFDYSPLLKYLTVLEIVNELEKVSVRYSPNTILLQSSLIFVDDHRLLDRFYNFVNIKIKNYMIEKFCYDTHTAELIIQFKIKNSNANTN